MRAKDKFEKKAVRHYQKGDYEKAVYWYTRAISLDPENAELYAERGVAYYHRNMLDESLADHDRARELEPDRAYRYSSRAYIKDAMGNTRGAVEDYKIAIELDPDDAVAHNNLGLLEEKLGHTAKAQALFDLADAMAKDQFGDPRKGVDRPKNIQKEIEESKKEKSLGTEMLNVFRSRETFREFLTFIRNGLK